MSMQRIARDEPVHLTRFARHRYRASLNFECLAPPLDFFELSALLETILDFPDVGRQRIRGLLDGGAKIAIESFQSADHGSIGLRHLVGKLPQVRFQGGT